MDRKRGIATREELDQLIADRQNDPARLELHYSPPALGGGAGQQKQTHIRMRERRIRYLERRLNGAARSMEREFERSS